MFELLQCDTCYLGVSVFASKWDMEEAVCEGKEGRYL